MQNFAERLARFNRDCCPEAPSLVDTRNFTDNLIQLLFPVKVNRLFTVEQILNKMKELKKQFEELVRPLENKLKASPEAMAEEFFSLIPDIYDQLIEEAEVYLQNDPAARSIEEVVLCYPGFYAVSVYRLAHAIHGMGIPLLPRMMTEYAHGQTGIDIHPGAKIGRFFFIDHGTGVVIGETTEIGEQVKLYQGVTLGALHVEKRLSDTKRHPTIGDRVIIYAGSTILGGNTVVGHDTIIGGNVWLTAGVEPYTVVYRKPKIMYRNHKSDTETSDFVI